MVQPKETPVGRDSAVVTDPPLRLIDGWRRTDATDERNQLEIHLLQSSGEWLPPSV